MIMDVQATASAIGQQLEIHTATTNRDISAAFRDAAEKRADAPLTSPDPLFTNRPEQMAILAARYAMPTIYAIREFAEAGG
jgi:putative tryptophan/tyrosine transport system substrate-binding protein